MDKYNDQLNRAEHYLQPGNFDVCSILCGKTMESVLKDLLNKYLEDATPEEKQLVEKYRTSLKKTSINRLMTGELVSFFEKNNILSSLAKKRSVDVDEVRLLGLRTMVGIRNLATHVHVKDRDLDLEKADAHMMYGSLLRLVRIADRLLDPRLSHQMSPREFTVKPERETRRIISSQTTKPLSPIQPQKTITLFRNKSSGKYFIYLEDESPNKVLFVTPDAQMKALDSTLFADPVDEEEYSAVKKGLIVAEQVKRYHEYVDQLDDELVIPKQSPFRGKIKVVRSPKSRATKLAELVTAGLLKEGQKLLFRHSGREIPAYRAVVSGDSLKWNGELYSMSRLAGKALKTIGLSPVVRGPIFWHTEKGESIAELWDRYLK